MDALDGDLSQSPGGGDTAPPLHGWKGSTVSTGELHSWNNITTNGCGEYNASGGRNASSACVDAVFNSTYGHLGMVTTLAILGTIILVAIIGNVFVIAAVVLERNLRNVANYLVASLAGADLMVATLVMPLTAVNEVSNTYTHIHAHKQTHTCTQTHGRHACHAPHSRQ